MSTSNGIIQSKPYELNKSMKYYSLTETSVDLIPVLIELWAWGVKHDPASTTNREELKNRSSKKQAIIVGISRDGQNRKIINALKFLG